MFDPRGGEDGGGPVVGAVTDALACLDKATTQDAWRLGEDGLAELVEALDGVRARTEQLMVAAIGEVEARGVHQSSGMSLTDWTAARSAHLSHQQAHQVVTVARACTERKHQPVSDAINAGQLSVGKACRLVRALDRIAPFVDAGTYADDVDLLVPVAIERTDAELARVTRHLVACAVPDKDTDAFTKSQYQARKVFESSLAGGMRRFVIEADPAGAAALRAVFASPLGAPQPQDATGADERTPGQRRYDALLTVLGRGMTSPEGVPTTARAKIFITLSYQQLAGDVAGLATTFTGTQLTPATVRQLACEAELIPVVLGGEGEILDMGRATRLATPAQRQALWLRDGGCTIPGCTIPAHWCDSHHVTWWSRGGRTDLNTQALLCPRHHTWVHTHDVTATIEATGVHWHL